LVAKYETILADRALRWLNNPKGVRSEVRPRPRRQSNRALQYQRHQIRSASSGSGYEAAGTRTEITGAWTFVCTIGIQCHDVFQ
jgi:hypothetical protein